MEQLEIAHDWCSKNNARLITPESPEYPKAFHSLEKPPQMLTYLGEPCWLQQSMLSVVGSRDMTIESSEWIERELYKVVKKDVVLVSGGARGVDQAAHAVAIRNKTKTIAFLPSGLAKCYPKNFNSWVKAIIDSGGAVVSELGPFDEMRSHYFEMRNRMIALLSPVVLVVQAKRKSGTLITARIAAENSRTVAAVPGFPGNDKWAGSVDLLVNGAFPIRDGEDILCLISSNSF